MTRPTSRELDKKIQEAKSHLQGQNGLFAQPAKAVGELEALDILDTKELWELILDLLEEIGPDDYAGTRPPMRSYEKTIEGKELFAFSWWSKRLEKNMYIKFALKDNKFYYVSLHGDKKVKI